MLMKTPRFKLFSILIYFVVFVVLIYLVIDLQWYKNELLSRKIYVREDYEFVTTVPNEVKRNPVLQNYEKQDWHDYEFMAYEVTREGPGERGMPYILTDLDDIKRNKELYEFEGLFAVVSDKISVNRSVPDVRIDQCKSKKYLSNLPSTSVIVIFNDEHWSILLRTLHGIVNRTPKELLHEIILVNDKSIKEELYEPLQNYVDKHFNGIVKVLNLPERKGLIVTRMEGAKIATGEVLVFFDAHVEVNANWLPPLIEPIALNPKVATCPIVDNLEPDTFKYIRMGDGTRGVFDWNFVYRQLPRRLKDMIEPDQPFQLPIMLGCAFAINRQYFWELGAYDEELLIWNGENYELSFKLHLCGGELLEVPCSRVAHMFRRHNRNRIVTDVDFVARNFKRIAEVWLDEYREKLYSGEPARYASIDAGDLTKPKAIRKELNCKPFQYYLDYVAPDMLERFRFRDEGDFAKGAIISEAIGTGVNANKKFCIDSFVNSELHNLGLSICDDNLIEPSAPQRFLLTWHRNVKVNSVYGRCIDVYDVSLLDCHYAFGNQFFKYDLQTHQLINTPTSSCLTANIQNRILTMLKCDANNINQRWDWGYKNITALQNWNTFGVKVPTTY